MNKIFTLIGLALCFSSFGQDQWIKRDSVNGAPRSVSAAFVADGDGFIVGGLDFDGFRRKAYSYTPWQDDWDDEPSIGGLNGSGLARGNASGFGALGKGYICLGQGETNGFFKDLWEFDPVTNVWTQKADFIGSPRRQAVAFSVFDKGYVGTGYDANGYCKDMYEYDPTTNVWIQKNDFGGTARKEAVGFTMGHLAFVGTGDDGVMKKDFWQYDPATDNWTQKTDMPGTARKGAVGWGQWPQAFICTGEDINFNFTTDLWEYNYWGDTWTQRADFIGAGRSNAIAFVLGDVAYVGTGYDGQFYDDFYAYQRVLNVGEIMSNANVNVFPNPVVDDFRITSDIYGLTVKIIDLNGKDVTSRISIKPNGKNFELSRNGVEPGNYMIQLYLPEIGKIYDGKVIFV